MQMSLTKSTWPHPLQEPSAPRYNRTQPISHLLIRDKLQLRLYVGKVETLTVLPEEIDSWQDLSIVATVHEHAMFVSDPPIITFRHVKQVNMIIYRIQKACQCPFKSFMRCFINRHEDFTAWFMRSWASMWLCFSTDQTTDQVPSWVRQKVDHCNYK